MSFRKICRFSMAVVCMTIFPAVLQAQPHGQPSAATKRAPKQRGPRFSGRERETITKYFTSPYSNLPLGLKGGGTDVPPNLRKEVVATNTLPPELKARVLRLPPPLEARLPKLAKPYQRAVVGPDIIILNTKTRQISDVMRSVLIPAHSMYN